MLDTIKNHFTAKNVTVNGNNPCITLVFVSLYLPLRTQ